MQPEPKKLVLYVAGQTPKSMAAIANLERICAEHAPNAYEIEVVDLKKQPQLARQHGIVAIPMSVRFMRRLRTSSPCFSTSR